MSLTSSNSSQPPPQAPPASDKTSPRSAQQRQAQRQYQRAQVEAASPTRLVVLLYDGAIRFSSLALEAMQNRDLESQNHYLIRAQRIIGELLSALDRQSGGEVAENLARLYVHMLEQLVHANLYDQIEPVEAVLKMLRELRDTWQEVDRMMSSQTQPSPP